MMTVEDLYALCHSLDYRIRALPLQSAPAASLPSGWIVLNPAALPDSASEKEKLAHELGHLETGSFPTGSPADRADRCEERADRWALRRLVPAAELCSALENGRVEVFELAEHFNVSEETIRRAFAYYREGSLLSLTPEEEKAVATLREYRPLRASFRDGGPPVFLFLRSSLLREAAGRAAAPSAPHWEFASDGLCVFLEERRP